MSVVKSGIIGGELRETAKPHFASYPFVKSDAKAGKIGNDFFERPSNKNVLELAKKSEKVSAHIYWLTVPVETVDRYPIYKMNYTVDLSFRKLLDTVLDSKYLRYTPPLNVLSLGSGMAGDFVSYLSREPQLKYVAVEINPERLELAQKISKDHKGIQLILADASHLSKKIPESQKFHIVQLRHQNALNNYSPLYSEMPLWKKIFIEGEKRRAPRGIILITSYYKMEEFFFLKGIKNSIPEGYAKFSFHRSEDETIAYRDIFKFSDEIYSQWRSDSFVTIFYKPKELASLAS